MEKNLPDFNNLQVAIIGLGYVGLPLSLEISKINKINSQKKESIEINTIGYDINKTRIKELKKGFDRTNETDPIDLKKSKNIEFTYQLDKLLRCEVFIVTTPTPVDQNKIPDLNPLKKAIETISLVINKKNISNKQNKFIVIIESTVYPGVTEEICIPLMEEITKLKCNEDFIFGYSPERINPGDKKHTLTKITKVTSGSSKEGSIWIDRFYGLFIKAGTYLAPNIKTAEAAKVIENIQRDINISLVNELSIIFKKLNIETLEVLKCAETKWNFLKFRPGLVGGHCIGVDPYYLTFKSEEIGYSPQVILSGRRINDSIAEWFSIEIIKELSYQGFTIKDLEILILGFTFKENCPDFRNTKVLDIVKNLRNFGAKTVIFDPEVDKKDVKEKLNQDIISERKLFSKKYKAIVLAVSHNYFVKMTMEEWRNIMYSNSQIFDLKGIIPKELNPKNF